MNPFKRFINLNTQKGCARNTEKYNSRLNVVSFIISCLSHFTFLQSKTTTALYCPFSDVIERVCVSYDVWYTFLPSYKFIFFGSRQKQEQDLIWSSLSAKKCCLQRIQRTFTCTSVCVIIVDVSLFDDWFAETQGWTYAFFGQDWMRHSFVKSVVKIEKLLNLMTDFLVADIKSICGSEYFSIYASHRFTCSFNKVNKSNLTFFIFTGLCTTLCLSSASAKKGRTYRTSRNMLHCQR